MGTRLLVSVAFVSACGTAVPTASIDEAATVCGAGPTVNGIDVSEYDDAVDWPTAKAAGIEFAFVRVSDGLAFPDTKFATYWPGARAAGVARGAYQYFEPNVDPIQQADFLLSSIGTLLPGDLPPVLDLETADGLSTADVTAAAQMWVGEITSAIGRPPIVYAGLYSWPTLTDGADMTTSPLWIAQYTTAACPDIPDPWTSWLFWQHSDTGVVNGVTSSQLDLDVFNGTADQLSAFTIGGGTPCGVIDASGGTIDDSDACFTPGGPSAYMRHVADAGYDNTLYWTHTTQAAAPVNYGEWELDFAVAGTYHVEAYTAAAYATSQAANYQVQTATSMQSVTIDQTAVDGWQSLGDIAFGAGGGQWILLGDDTGEATQKQLVFDAIRFTPLDGSGSGGSGSDGSGSDDHGSGKTAGCSTTGDDDGVGLVLPLWLAFGLIIGRARLRRFQRLN
jgi:GH25 family lysozyme M1 (1,4-beta-N-acetylmuramidase)